MFCPELYHAKGLLLMGRMNSRSERTTDIIKANMFHDTIPCLLVLLVFISFGLWGAAVILKTQHDFFFDLICSLDKSILVGQLGLTDFTENPSMWCVRILQFITSQVGPVYTWYKPVKLCGTAFRYIFRPYWGKFGLIKMNSGYFALLHTKQEDWDHWNKQKNRAWW